jgi:GT2 family glycosyltransferase
MEQEYPHEIIVVDNCSQDTTVEFLKAGYPIVTLIESPSNLGFGAANNLGIRHVKGEYVVFLNPDTIVNKNWLSALILPLANGKKIITTPKILTYDGLKINTCGNINHFTGLTFTRGLDDDPSCYHEIEEVSGVSGACFVMRIRDFLELGEFDEHFFLYNEDAEFSWRAHTFNYTILCIPGSIIHHKYHLEVSPEKLYFLEKGRYMTLRKYYSIQDIFLIGPSLLITEILTLGYTLHLGRRGIKSKVTALRDGFRADIDILTISRKALLPHLCVTIPEDQLTFNKIEQVVKVICNSIFRGNLKIIG